MIHMLWEGAMIPIRPLVAGIPMELTGDYPLHHQRFTIEETTEVIAMAVDRTEDALHVEYSIPSCLLWSVR